MRYFLAIITALALLSTASTLDAQVRAHLNINVGTQPIWGPTGYDYVEYYYLPDIDVYYNIPQHCCYYNAGGRWISSGTLPSRYRHYNFYNSYKVVVNDREPWRNHETYKEKYSGYRDRHEQQSIRDSRDARYFANVNHPEHRKWADERKHDRGNHDGGNRDNNGNRGNKDNRQRNDRDRNDGKDKR